MRALALDTFQYPLFPKLKKKSNNKCHEIWHGDDVNRTFRLQGAFSHRSIAACVPPLMYWFHSIRTAVVQQTSWHCNVLFTSAALYCVAAWPWSRQHVCVCVCETYWRQNAELTAGDRTPDDVERTDKQVTYSIRSTMAALPANNRDVQIEKH